MKTREQQKLQALYGNLKLSGWNDVEADALISEYARTSRLPDINAITNFISQWEKDHPEREVTTYGERLPIVRELLQYIRDYIIECDPQEVHCKRCEDLTTLVVQVESVLVQKPLHTIPNQPEKPEDHVPDAGKMVSFEVVTCESCEKEAPKDFAYNEPEDANWICLKCVNSALNNKVIELETSSDRLPDAGKTILNETEIFERIDEIMDNLRDGTEKIQHQIAFQQAASLRYFLTKELPKVRISQPQLPTREEMIERAKKYIIKNNASDIMTIPETAEYLANFASEIFIEQLKQSKEG